MRNIKWSTWAVGVLFTAALVLLSAQTARSVYSSPVTVVNPSNQPVQGADVEKLARIPYSSSIYNSSCTPGPGACFFFFTPVPAGYRLVVENVSGYFQVSPAATAPVVGYLEDNAFRVAIGVTAPLGQLDPGGHIQAAFNQPTRIYNDNGQGLFAVISSNWSNGANEVVVTGYLENCSITGCPAVVH